MTELIRGSLRKGLVPLGLLLIVGSAFAACTSDQEGSGPDTTATVTETSTSSTAPSSEETTTTDAESTSTTTASTTTTTTAIPDTGVELFVSPTGLTLNDSNDGTASKVAFGHDRSTTVELVDQALGSAGVISDGFAECPNGQESVAEWPDLVLDFDLDEKLISWRLPQGSTLTDADGIGLGSPRSDLSAELQATIEESTIGIEFGTRDTILGILSGPDDGAIIESLYSIDTCAFR